MRCLFVAVALVAACSSSPRPTGGGGGGSGGAADMTNVAPFDLAPRGTARIACGATACTQALQLCCTGDSGKTGDCQERQNPMCGVTSFYCDGPEDCPPEGVAHRDAL